MKNIIEKQIDDNISKKSDIVKRMSDASELADNPVIVKEVLKYGNVPVLYGPTKSMLRKPKEPGLIHLIENANTIKEIQNLLKNGKEKYKNVSTGTIKKWEISSQRRILELNNIK